MARGRLRIYLGSAPGVGKTYAMLDEGVRRKERGTDVVVGFVETYGRPRTDQQIRDLEVVAHRTIDLDGQILKEMDVDAIVARGPDVALVDELAHTNVAGSRNEKRWQDINEILDAGIDVISTVNVQHLESLNDVVEEITGTTQQETVPDAFVRTAEQVELVDMTPEALRRRMAHGNIYTTDKIDDALENYFRVGNLTAMRELALLWVADQVDTALHDYRERHGIAHPWETRERVAVALTGAPGADDLIRRAARIAARSKAELIGIHVGPLDSGDSGLRGDLDEHRRLLTDLGGRYRGIIDTEISSALVSTALAENATQLVLGASRRSRWAELTQGSLINKIAQRAGGGLDIHIIATDPGSEDQRVPATPRSRGRLSRLSRRRQFAGLLAAILGLPALTMLLVSLRERLGFASIGFCYLLAVVGIGTVGGAWVALLAAIGGFLLLNLFFAEPIHTLNLANERDAIALVVFLVVAGVVSLLVERAARRSADATRARSDAEALASMAGLLLREDDPLNDLVAILQATFALDGVSVLRSLEGRWQTEAVAGPTPPTQPDGALLALPLAEDVRLVLAGSRLTPADRHVLDAFATQLAIALESRRLRGKASQTVALGKANDLRNTILAALSHDLRTPLTTIKTAASSLLDGDPDFDADTRRELLKSIDDESDRLNSLVANLLDLGRLQAHAVIVQAQTTDIGDVVAMALASIPRDREVMIDIPQELPPANADPVLLERAIANLLTNALRYSPPTFPVTLRAIAIDGKLEVRVIDRGKGIPRRERQRVFQPFERLGDSPEAAGVGLGLAVARGFMQTMGGDLAIDETPGGGTTMIATLKACADTERVVE